MLHNLMCVWHTVRCCCSKLKARLQETREALARLQESAGMAGRMATFEKAQDWAVVQARLSMAEALRQKLEVRVFLWVSAWG